MPKFKVLLSFDVEAADDHGAHAIAQQVRQTIIQQEQYKVTNLETRNVEEVQS